MNATTASSVSFAPKHLSGIDVIDNSWGGLYRGGSYLIYGRSASGRGLLTLMFARTGARMGESTLFISSDRQKDLMIQAASIGFNLRSAYESGIVRLMRVPPLMNLQNMGDDGVAKALWDLVTLIRQHRPTRLVMNDFMPFVAFRSFDRFRNEFIQFLEQIDSLDTTMTLVMPEPANQQSRRVIDFMATQMTGSVHIELAEDNPSTTKRRITLIPHIGHIKRQVVDYWDLEDLVDPDIEETQDIGEKRRSAEQPAWGARSSEKAPSYGPPAIAAGLPSSDPRTADVPPRQTPPSEFSPQQAPPSQFPPQGTVFRQPPHGYEPRVEPEEPAQPSRPEARGAGQPDSAPTEQQYIPTEDQSATPQPTSSDTVTGSRGGSTGTSPEPRVSGGEDKSETGGHPGGTTSYYRDPYAPPQQPTGPERKQEPQQPTGPERKQEPQQPAGPERKQGPQQPRPSEQPQERSKTSREQRQARDSRGPGHPPAQKQDYNDRESFRIRLQQQFNTRESVGQPFLLLALRMDRADRRETRPFDFDFLIDLVKESLRPTDDMLVDSVRERLVVLLADARPEEAQDFFARLKDLLRKESPRQADTLLHSVSAIVVPDGRPFQSAEEFLSYALDEQ